MGRDSTLGGLGVFALNIFFFQKHNFIKEVGHKRGYLLLTCNVYGNVFNAFCFILTPTNMVDVCTLVLQIRKQMTGINSIC